jgi:hypothetical protein
MRARRIIRISVVCYAVFCAILAIFLGELAFRPQRVRVKERPSAEAAAARFGAACKTFRLPPAMVGIFRAGLHVRRMGRWCCSQAQENNEMVGFEPTRMLLPVVLIDPPTIAS